MPSRLTRILTSPLTPIIAGAIFLYTVWLLPIRNPSPSSAGALIARKLGQPRKSASLTTHFPTPFERVGDRFVAFGETPTEAPLHAMPISSANACWIRAQTGLWAPIVETWTLATFIEDGTSTQDDVIALRTTYFAHLASLTYPINAKQLSILYSGPVFHSSVIWAGHLHNSASLLSFLIFITSAPLAARKAWRVLRISSGHCPHCAYDLRVTPPHSPCPECGRKRSDSPPFSTEPNPS